MGRELDVKVAKALGYDKPPDEGLHWRPDPRGLPGTWIGEEQVRYTDGSWSRSIRLYPWPEHYSSSIAVAWELFEQLGPAWCIAQTDAMGWREDARWWCFLPVEYGGTGEEFKAATAPEAICKAFLAWKEADDG